MASPGEFTRLALENGRLDLTQVEGIADLLDAQTEQQRRLAIQQSSGHSAKAYNAIRNSLIDALANIEALIDFSEDDHIDESAIRNAQDTVSSAIAQIENALRAAARHEVLRSGIKLTIFGPPNVGKSSLLNLLAQRDAAIVSPIAGTTRDLVELSFDLFGFSVVLTDTAGIRENPELVEAIGIDRAMSSAMNSDIKICVLSAESLHLADLGLDKQSMDLLDENTIVIINKMDLIDSRSFHAWYHALPEHSPFRTVKGLVPMQILGSEGISLFEETTQSLLEHHFSFLESDNSLVVSQERHRLALKNCVDHLYSFQQCNDDVVLAAEHLRLAAVSIGNITSVIDIEDVLDKLFSSFCIGK